MARILVRLTLLAILILTMRAGAGEPERATDLHGGLLPPGAIARLGTLRFRAARGVQNLAFSPDGSQLVAKSRSNISVWDVATGRMRSEIVEADAGPLAWRADGGGIMLVHERNRAIRIDDFTRDPSRTPSPPAEGGMKFELKGDGSIVTPDDDQWSEYAISPNGKILVAGRSGNQERARAISVWALEPGKRLTQLRLMHTLGPQQGACHQIVFSPDSTHVGIISGPNWPTLTQSLLFVLYDLSTGKERARRTVPMPSKNGAQMTVALAKGGTWLAVGGNDNICRLYDLSPSGALATFGDAKAASRNSGWSAVAFAGNQVFAASWVDRSLHVHDVKTGRAIRPAVKTADWIEAMALAPDGTRLATAGQAGIIRLWDVASGREIDPPAGHEGLITQVHLTADGERALTAGNDGTPRLWELNTGKELRRFEIPIDSTALGLTPDKKALLVLVGVEIRAFDLASGAPIPVFPGLAKASRTARFFAGNAKSLIIGDALSIAVWDWTLGQLRRRFDFRTTFEGANYGQPLDAGLTPDGKTLIVRTPLGVDSWDVASGAFQNRMPDSYDRAGRGFAFLDSGRYLALAAKHAAAKAMDRPAVHRFALWDMRSGKLVRLFEPLGSQLSHDLVADPRSYLLASAEQGEEATTALYEVASGQLRRRLPGHSHINTTAVFTPDGNKLVTVGGDKTGLVWDLSFPSAVRGKKRGSEAELERAWEDLAKIDAARAYEALLTFASNPNLAVAIVRQRLRPATLDLATVERLLAELDSASFATRERASKELEALGRPTIVAIQTRAQKGISLELKRRLMRFLDKHELGPLLPDELRALRSLEFLESIGGPAAQAVIADLAKGEPSAELTIRARAAMERLDRRKQTE